MEGTRLRILQLLQKDGHATVEGLATGIGLAPATIRRHLDILQRDRLVGFDEVRKRTGRPEYSFYLTEDGQESLPKDYDRLLAMVVDEIGMNGPQFNSDQLVHILLAEVPDFERATAVQQALSGLPQASTVAVIEFEDTSASIDMELAAPVNVRQIMEQLREQTGRH